MRPFFLSLAAALSLLPITGCETHTVTRPQQPLVHAPERPDHDRDGAGTSDGAAQPPPRAARKASPLSDATDPCAGRLHDVCGILLQFYRVNHRIPATAEELDRAVRLDPTLELKCPISGKPYVYNPVGIMTTDKQPRVILYDAEPSHEGYRWAIGIIEPQDENGPLITKVVALPESSFTLRAPPR